MKLEFKPPTMTAKLCFFLKHIVDIKHFIKSKMLMIVTLALFLVRQAYSVYDEEVGYCQGISFFSAVLLLHVSYKESPNI